MDRDPPRRDHHRPDHRHRVVAVASHQVGPARHDAFNDNQVLVQELDMGDGLMDHDHRRVIAIDGPGAAGKSTVADQLAKRLHALLFDTGAIYRAVTLAARRRNLDVSDAAALTGLAKTLPIALRPPSVADGRQVDVLLGDEDVTWAIRTPDIDSHVSAVSAHPPVRDALLQIQRNIANDATVVMVGRDIGTVVVPDAGVKIFLDASAEERARRRLVDLEAKGIEADYATVLADLQARDAWDSNRAVAPLKAADDAITIHSDGRTVQEIVEEIASIAQERWSPSAVRQ